MTATKKPVTVKKTSKKPTVAKKKPAKPTWVGTGKAGPGRPKGSRNKLSIELKEMILTALDDAGGVKYLQRQANENPAAFLSLVGKVLPMTVANPDGSALQAPQFVIMPTQAVHDDG